jgi:hypothetical protein
LIVIAASKGRFSNRAVCSHGLVPYMISLKCLESGTMRLRSGVQKENSAVMII